MYINFKKLEDYGLVCEYFFLLIAIKQKEELNTFAYYDEDIVEVWLEAGIIKKLKGGDLRLDKKGLKILKDITDSSEITKDTEILVEWLIKVYKAKGGIVRNKKETKRRLQWFSDQTGFYGNKLALLLQCFINDTYDKDSGLSIDEAKRINPRLQLSVMVDNVMFTPPNNFSTKYSLDNSPLWDYYEENESYIEDVWEENRII